MMLVDLLIDMSTYYPSMSMRHSQGSRTKVDSHRAKIEIEPIDFQVFG